MEVAPITPTPIVLPVEIAPYMPPTLYTAPGGTLEEVAPPPPYISPETVTYPPLTGGYTIPSDGYVAPPTFGPPVDYTLPIIEEPAPTWGGDGGYIAPIEEYQAPPLAIMDPTVSPTYRPIWEILAGMS